MSLGAYIREKIMTNFDEYYFDGLRAELQLSFDCASEGRKPYSNYLLYSGDTGY